MDFVFPLWDMGGYVWRSELGHTSGDTDGNVGQSGDSIRGPGEEASDDLHRPSAMEQKKQKAIGFLVMECSFSPLPVKVNGYYV